MSFSDAKTIEITVTTFQELRDSPTLLLVCTWPGNSTAIYHPDGKADFLPDWGDYWPRRLPDWIVNRAKIALRKEAEIRRPWKNLQVHMLVRSEGFNFDEEECQSSIVLSERRFPRDQDNNELTPQALIEKAKPWSGPAKHIAVYYDDTDEQKWSNDEEGNTVHLCDECARYAGSDVHHASEDEYAIWCESCERTLEPQEVFSR